MKALLEKKNSLMAQAEEMLANCETEVRGLNAEENEKYENLVKEIEKVNEEIRAAEEENKKDAVVVEIENEEVKGEERNMELTKELEMRGIEQYLKKQDGEELRAMTVSANGKLVPTYLHQDIVQSLPEVAPLFSMVPKITPVAGTVRIAVEDNLGEASFVGESQSLSAVDATFKYVELKQVRAGSAVEINQHLINDAGIDAVSYCQNLLFRRLGFALDRAMITGTGTDNIQGLNVVKTSDAETCKVETAASNVIAIDDLMKMAADMETVYQSGAKWIMNRDLFEQIFLLKDGNGRPYLVRDVVNDVVTYRLLGLEVLINDAAKNVFLVNFAHAYSGMIKKDVALTTVSSDKASALAGTVTLVLDTYVDAKIVQPKAIRYLEIKA